MSKKTNTRAANLMGTLRKRKDGRWEGRYTAPDGRQHSVYGKTQKAAAEALRAATHEVDTGTWLQPSTMSMNQWFDIWLSDYQSHTSGRTVETYTAVIRRHMRPLFGKVKLADFAAVHVNRLVSDMTKAGLTPSTVRHAKAILSAALKSAVDAKLIRENPADLVRTRRAAPAPFSIVDRDQFPAFIAAANTTPVGAALIFLLMTGLRSGELRGLRWSDADLDAGTLRVERQLRVVNKHDRRFEPPKDNEVRTIHLTPQAVALLRQQRRDQAAARLAAGAAWHEDDISADLIFRTTRGLELPQNALFRAIRAIRDGLGLPDLRPHDLRHSYAVAALRSGVDPKTVQHNLGHRHATVTLDTYAAYTDDAGKTGAQKLSAYWLDATSEN
jgi:integrase